ncbi:phosphatidylinositol 4,5-bisphosphate 5-phosphatase A-like isoform X1 [Cimex lectularius]|uniref:Inositol polyphosphate-related phosphatase domain-containing protein n=2 Tax=Cimex lectularius TaxID=79782 RepID=A0A8I6RIW7_CIMLE|nr:phosphatidylinositol 4,5-bisphosphate 5-phosphatase A-like isoform X1 [Cimex lectularius]
MDELRIRVVTYNVAGKSPCEDLNEMFNLEGILDNKLPPDFYIIGLQEVKSTPHNYILDTLFSDPWTKVFRDLLAPYGYVKVKTVRLVGIVMSMFCLRKHIIHLRDMKTLCTRTGLKGLWGNKGGTSQRLQIYGCSLCFVNCHLAAHDKYLKERISDYNTILNYQKFMHLVEYQHILFHDYIFWFGDLNFRLAEDSLSAEEILIKINSKEYKTLLNLDQLKAVMASGEAFSELIEPDITFKPTYKYFANSNEYDLGRRPAWTDRILYKVNENVYENVTLSAKPDCYESVDEICVSDHKPVVATFTIKVFSNYAERCVRIAPIGNWYANTINKAFCFLGEDVQPSIWDWVGVFQDGFTSLEEYVAFIYISNNHTDLMGTTVAVTPPKNGDKIELNFYENIIRMPGKYRLLYFTHDSGSVLGMSQPFELVGSDEQPGASLEW